MASTRRTTMSWSTRPTHSPCLGHSGPRLVLPGDSAMAFSDVVNPVPTAGRFFFSSPAKL